MTVTIANLTSTWIDTETHYTGIGLNVNAVGYSSDSRVFDMKVNGNTIFSIAANGTFYGNLVANIPNTFNVISANAVFSNTIRSNTITTVNTSSNIANVLYVLTANNLNANVISSNTLTSNIITGNVISSNVLISNVISSNTLTSNIITGNVIKTVSNTVSNLSNAITQGAGTRSFVTDANNNVFLARVFSGGTNAVPVFSNGTYWLIG